MAENFYNLLPFRHFFHEAVELTHRLLLFKEVLCRFAAYALYYENHNGKEEQNYERERKAVKHHEREYENNGKSRRYQLRNSLRKKLAHGIDIVGVKAHKVAVSVRIEVFKRQILHFRKHFVAHLL